MGGPGFVSIHYLPILKVKSPCSRLWNIVILDGVSFLNHPGLQVISGVQFIFESLINIVSRYHDQISLTVEPYILMTC